MAASTQKSLYPSRRSLEPGPAGTSAVNAGQKPAEPPGPKSLGVRRQSLLGLGSMLLACFMFAVMATCVYAASRTQPPVAAAMVSFIRVSLNLLILVLPAMALGKVRGLFGDLRPSLWLRGLFGGVALILSFASIQRIGPGESAFLSASSGIFVAALGPWVLGQRNLPRDWLAILGALIGLLLLLQPRLDTREFMGRLMGLSSGLLAALAYLMIARSGRSNAPRTVVFYFCLVAVLIHGAWFAFRHVALPEGRSAWSWALAAGLTGSVAQLYLTRAYQLAPATLVSAVGYSAPVMSMVFGVFLFDKIPGTLALMGSGLIIICGVALPFLTVRRTQFRS
jgi:drug/metabolite transporter (DMT)-like permease